MLYRLTQQDLRAIAGPKATKKHTQGVVDHLDMLGQFDMLRPQRLAHFICQIGHESDRFRTTQEYASGRAYEGRRDLGNTQPGDGVRFKGHGLIQCTGRYNHTKCTEWCQANFDNAPDFVRHPKKLMEHPWAMVSAIWYWQVGNPTGKSLNRYADNNDIEMITRRINGGLNGFDDRCFLYTRTALVMLGYELKAGVVADFQRNNNLVVDDVAGPATRRALHFRLGDIEADFDGQTIPGDGRPSPPPLKPADKPTPKPAPQGGFFHLIRLLIEKVAALLKGAR